ncbi:hypothetical protein BU16DRAFT_121022 [Lophium mytilinum]|uniref:Serine-rich protein n=1 Tax=Lophium mytilinum TaxID=390894 RepID=A0A6A6QHT0_9PEZI|nr:hypothetical protein BU16DRAFT_121022 [Lophium mytilinum]
MSSNTTRTARSHSPKHSPHSSAHSSPKRRPLHERSDSQTNQYSSPTIRIVEDPGAQIYGKSPFPSNPAQLLPPRKAPAGYAFEDRGARVSDRNDATNTVPNPETINTLVPKPLQPRRADRSSASTTSDADTVVNNSPFSPSSSRFSTGTTPPVSPTAPGHERLSDLGTLQESAPSPKRSTIRAVIPSFSSEGHALTPRASAASLASTASSETFTYRAHEDRRPSSSSNPRVPLTPPLRSHRRPPPTGSNGKKKQASSINRVPLKPALKSSSESLASSDLSYEYDRPRSSSSPTLSSSPPIYAARQVSLESGVRVQFPIVRPPSASGLFAESRVLPKHPSRMNNRASQVHQWSSQLSTIASESERGSNAGSQQISDRGSQLASYRSSQSVEHPRPSAPIPRRQTISSVASSDNAVYNSEPTDSSVSVPLPLFSPSLRPEEGRESDEHRDVVSPLQSPPLRQQRSGYLSRHNSNDSRPGSRPGSSQSDFANFIASTIPAWARVYYRRGDERTSMGAPDSSTEASDSRVPTAQSGRTQTPSEGNFPLSIYRPRNRPHQQQSQDVADSMVISNVSIEQDISVFGPMTRRPISEMSAPRLRPDKRSTARLSAWRAPSLDETFSTMMFSRQNRQILLFCLGFIFPFAWMIASFLPIPPNPELSKEATPSQADLERQLAQHVGPVDGRNYQKAFWWRNLNRIMSAVGILLIGAIIALAIVASRM